ncbi:hypothetical protein ACS0TY_031468 [Phlomoides rotata]
MGKQHFQGGNYNQGKPNFQSQQQGQFPQNTQGRYNANSNFQGGSSYNPNFKSHENFSYANQRAAVQFPPGFNPGAKPPNNEGRPSQDDAMEAMFKKMDEFMKGTSSHIKSLEQQMGTQIKTLEHQMGQLASTVGEQHQRGKFPSTTETNPKEHCKAIKLRSGTKYDGPSNPLDEGEKVQEEKEEVNEEPLEEEEELELGKEDEEEKGMGTEMKKKKEQEKMKEKVEEEVRVPKWREAKDKKQDPKEVELDHWGVPKIGVPFPQRFMKKKMDEKFSKFLEVFKKLHLNIPFHEALEQMPHYAKFLKDLISKKRRIEEPETVKLTVECSALLEKHLPQKMKDLGSFTIMCDMGNGVRKKALCDLGASINLMPLSIFEKLNNGELLPTSLTLQLVDRSTTIPKGIVEDVLVKIDKFVFPADFVVLDMEEDEKVPIILWRPFLATAGVVLDVSKGELTLKVGDEKLTISMYQAMKHPMDGEECKSIEVVELCVQEALEDPSYSLFLDNSNSYHDIEYECFSFDCDRNLMEIEEVNEVRKNHFGMKALREPVQGGEIKEEKKEGLKSLPEHLKYAYLEDNEKFPVIVSSSLNSFELERLLKVLCKHKKAIGWSIEDLKGINPSICMHRIRVEEGSKPVVQNQRRVNPIMQEVIRKEVLKFLDAGKIYPISDSPWVSPLHVVSKKGGITVVKMENDELLATRLITGWRVCVDYRELNKVTAKDHFPLPFIDQMFDRLGGYDFYCFLDGYSGYNQIMIHPEDQEKTTFTCTYGTFAWRWMPFGLCNAPGTFQRCMMSIFNGLIENIMEVFMDDFSVFGESFDSCLTNLDVVLQRCEDTNLVLNWEKCHFMVREGIVLGHHVSSQGLQVDRAKVVAIEKLPPPTNEKGVRSFLGHAGFYRRFIKDFSKISKPLSHLLEKDVPYEFTNECLVAFRTLKEALVSSPILVTPDWKESFVLMCDASDFAMGVVLGQLREKRFRAIYYASKTFNSAQINYTTTEKELLAVVYAFDKFRPYLVGAKTIVYTDHAAIRYLMSKKDAKPRLIRWILLLQEFDIEVKDKKGSENVIADHLSRLEQGEDMKRDLEEVGEEFPDERLLRVDHIPVMKVEGEIPWYADFANYLASGSMPSDLSPYEKKKFLKDVKHYFWDDPFLFKIGIDSLIRRCLPHEEWESVIQHCHTLPCGDHFGVTKTGMKILQSGFFWPKIFKSCREYIKHY